LDPDIKKGGRDLSVNDSRPKSFGRVDPGHDIDLLFKTTNALFGFTLIHIKENRKRLNWNLLSGKGFNPIPLSVHKDLLMLKNNNLRSRMIFIPIWSQKRVELKKKRG